MLLILGISLVFGCTSIKTNVTFAEEKINIALEKRELIESVIFNTAYQNGFVVDEFNYNLNDIFLTNEEWGGYVVDFILNEANGYAIFFELEEQLHLIEINFNESSPYYGKLGKFIYPSLGIYLIKYNDEYYDALSLEIIDFTPDDEYLFYASCKDKDTDDYTVEVRKLEYLSGNMTSYSIPNFFANYTYRLATNQKNCCANIAGIVMLNYWNKKYNNDLLKETVSYTGNIVNETATKYIDMFYKEMNTNWFFSTGGTLPSDCYKGFEKVIKNKGYSVSRKENLKFNDMKESIDNGIPVFIVSKDYYFSEAKGVPNLSSEQGIKTLTISYQRRKGIGNSHTFVGFGYVDYILRQPDGSVINEELINVADGWGLTRYFNMEVGKVYSSASINVYK